MTARKRQPTLYRILTSKGLTATYPRFIKWFVFTKKEVCAFRKLIKLQKGIDTVADESYFRTGALDADRIAIEVEKRNQYLANNPVDLRRYELFLLHLKDEQNQSPDADPAKKYGVDPHFYSMYIDTSIFFCI